MRQQIRFLCLSLSYQSKIRSIHDSNRRGSTRCSSEACIKLISSDNLTNPSVNKQINSQAGITSRITGECRGIPRSLPRIMSCDIMSSKYGPVMLFVSFRRRFSQQFSFFVVLRRRAISSASAY